MEKIKQIGNVISDSTFKYMVVGFTDSIGSVEYNEKLAEKRAKSVYNKLVDLGVKPEQIEIKYVGKNSSFGDSGSYINRRVSVYRVIK
jgi:OOP family OmpA-OmpF porin